MKLFKTIAIIILTAISSVGGLLLYQQYRNANAPRSSVPLAELHLLRELAYQQGTVAHDYGTKIDSGISYSMSLSELREIYRANTLGGYCNNIAELFRKILDAHAIENYRISFEIEGISHTLNLVLTEYGGREIYTLQDSYFNTMFADRDGEPLDYFTMIELLQQRRHDEIQVIEFPLTPRTALCTGFCGELANPSNCTRMGDYVACDSLYYWHDYLATLNELPVVLSEHGYPADWRYLLLMVSGIGGRGGEEMLVKIEAAGAIVPN